MEFACLLGCQAWLSSMLGTNRPGTQPIGRGYEIIFVRESVRNCTQIITDLRRVDKTVTCNDLFIIKKNTCCYTTSFSHIFMVTCQVHPNNYWLFMEIFSSGMKLLLLTVGMKNSITVTIINNKCNHYV